MLRITDSERQALESVGLLKTKNNKASLEPNFIVINKKHNHAKKRIYVVENMETLLFLEKYDELNLQILRPGQLEYLKKNNLIKENQIQYSGTYVPNAIVYIAHDGTIRCKKVTSIMIGLNIWKSKSKGGKKNEA